MGEEERGGMCSYLEQGIQHGICLAIKGQKNSDSHEFCDSEGK